MLFWSENSQHSPPCAHFHPTSAWKQANSLFLTDSRDKHEGNIDNNNTQKSGRKIYLFRLWSDTMMKQIFPSLSIYFKKIKILKKQWLLNKKSSKKSNITLEESFETNWEGKRVLEKWNANWNDK